MGIFKKPRLYWSIILASWLVRYSTFGVCKSQFSPALLGCSRTPRLHEVYIYIYNWLIWWKEKKRNYCGNLSSRVMILFFTSYNHIWRLWFCSSRVAIISEHQKLVLRHHILSRKLFLYFSRYPRTNPYEHANLKMHSFLVLSPFRDQSHT